MGQVEPTRIDRRRDGGAPDARPEYAPVAQSLREVGMRLGRRLFATYAGRAADLKAWLADAQINRDRNLRLQYLAGLGLNVYQSDAIYTEILQYRRYPDGLFTGSDSLMQSLRWSIAERVPPGDEP